MKKSLTRKRRAAKRRVKQHALAACYDVVAARAKGRCERCGIAISPHRPRWHPQRSHLNHKVPRSLGGADTPENTEMICQGCHLPGGQHAPTKERMDALRSEEL